MEQRTHWNKENMSYLSLYRPISIEWHFSKLSKISYMSVFSSLTPDSSNGASSMYSKMGTQCGFQNNSFWEGWNAAWWKEFVLDYVVCSVHGFFDLNAFKPYLTLRDIVPSNKSKMIETQLLISTKMPHFSVISQYILSQLCFGM